MMALYLLLAVLGAVIPYSRFVPWVLDHGFDMQAFAVELFATRIGSFFGLDVIVSAVTLLIYIRHEGRRRGLRLLWLPQAATLLIGVSCGLPLFLYLRERQCAVRA